MKTEKIRFKVPRDRDGMVFSHSFVGFVRGLTKCGMGITVNNTIETHSTKEFYIIDIDIKEGHFIRAKDQAESYGVKVEKVNP